MYFLVTSIYGWIHWLRGGQGHTVLHVTRASARVWVVSGVVGVVFWYVDATLTSQIKGVAFPYIDAATTTISLIAQWMITRKLLENWILWIVVNVVYVPMLLYKGLYPTALLYFVMLLIAIKGFIDWRKSYENVIQSRAAAKDLAGVPGDPSLRTG
jgi:nicotinamide mononucleotide transporter